MRFGGSQLPMRLRVARTILYCQATVMALIGAFALEALIIGGASTGGSLTGVVDKQTLTGSGVTAVAVVLVAIAIVLIVVEQQVTVHRGGTRLMFAGVELALAVYLIGFMQNSVQTWLFGPACGVAILILHYWPELHSYFYAADPTTPANAIPVPPAPADPDADADAIEPNSDATTRPHL
jgi:hypothetical protein